MLAMQRRMEEGTKGSAMRPPPANATLHHNTPVVCRLLKNIMIRIMKGETAGRLDTWRTAKNIDLRARLFLPSLATTSVQHPEPSSAAQRPEAEGLERHVG
jgi:hypothetical protein